MSIFFLFFWYLSYKRLIGKYIYVSILESWIRTPDGLIQCVTLSPELWLCTSAQNESRPVWKFQWILVCLLNSFLADDLKLQFIAGHLNLTIPSCFVSIWRFNSPFRVLNEQPSSLQNVAFLFCFWFCSPLEWLEKMCLFKSPFFVVLLSQYSQL